MKLLFVSILIIGQVSFSFQGELPLFTSSKHPLINLLTNTLNPPKLPHNIKPNATITSHTIKQRVNPFNAQDLRTFTHHYLMNDEFFTPGGPIIIFLYMFPFTHGMGKAYISSGPVYDLASELNGTLVHPQHRYYEDSNVMEDLSLENLRFLTVAHVLEDLANLVRNLKTSRSYSNSGVIMVGWSYGASLATWFAQKYPHLVDGIWASGPLSHQSLNQPQPVQIVDSAVRQHGGDKCSEMVRNAFSQLEEMIANNQSRVIRRAYRLCFPLPYMSGNRDLWYFFIVISKYFYTYAEVFDETVMRDVACARIVNAPVEHDFERIAYALGLMDIPQPLCYPLNFAEMIEEMRTYAVDIESDLARARAFMYQQCTEFASLYNSGDGSSMFGRMFPIDFFVAACTETFGITRQQMEVNFQRTNTIYGGHVPATRNAYFTVGEFNPFREQSVNGTKVHPTSTYELIPMRGLHTELSFDIKDPAFYEIRRRIFEKIRKWLNL